MKRSQETCHLFFIYNSTRMGGEMCFCIFVWMVFVCPKGKHLSTLGERCFLFEKNRKGDERHCLVEKRVDSWRCA